MNKIRIVPLGGISHVTRNMFVYEFWPESGEVARIIVDCGFGFPEEEMLGVDVVLPDISYLKDKEKTILGIVITHGHDDHIGALPYILPQIGPVPVYAAPLTAGFIENNLADFRLNYPITVVKDHEAVNLGPFSFEYVQVTHSVPNSKHIVIKTPIGVFYHGSDFKFDFTPVDGKRPDLQKMALVGKQGVLCLLSDCLRVEKEGFTPSESLLEQSFEREIRNCPGKFIVTTISSNIHRIQQAVKAAASFNRKVVFLGRSIEENIAVAQQLGFFSMPANAYLKKSKIDSIPENKLCLIVAGSQGQADSTLVRIANDSHDRVQIKPGDKVVFSADPIPGNENAFYQTIDKLSKLGAVVSYSDILDNLHVSGHASSGELKIFLSLIKPQNVIPIGGSFRHMNHFRNLALSLDMPKDKIHLLADGQIISFDQNGVAHLEEVLDLKTIIVDGSGVGDVGPVVLSDRKKMSQEGIVVVTIPVKQGTNQIVGQAEIISRGFVYMKRSKDLMEEAKRIIQKDLPELGKVSDWIKTRTKIEKDLGNLFYKETGREPMILPVIVKI